MESDSDSDYNPGDTSEIPSNNVLKVNLTQAKQVLDDINKAIATKSSDKKEISLEEAMKTAKAVKEALSAKNNIKVNFAGQSTDFKVGKRNRDSLDQVISQTKNNKTVNSLAKSTLDWEKYKQDNQLEGVLSNNRKDGFINKKNFLISTKEREKDLILSLKRKRLN
jgi:Bucentaur or craniofacial development